MKEEVRRSIEHANSVTADSVEEARKQVTARGRDQQG
jgi:enoyl-CoA hydratase